MSAHIALIIRSLQSATAVMELIDKIARQPPLSRLPREQLLRLIAGARLKDYPPAFELFRQADMPKYLYLLLSGMVKLWAPHESRAGAVHGIMKPGSVFLLPAVISQTPYVVGAATVKQAEIVQLPAERIHKEVLSSSGLAAKFLHLVSHQYQNDMLRCIETCTLTTTQRLGRLLLRLAVEQNNRTISLPCSKRLLAVQLQMTPESLSRALQRLKPYITWLDHARIRLDDIDALSALAKFDSNQPMA